MSLAIKIVYCGFAFVFLAGVWGFIQSSNRTTSIDAELLTHASLQCCGSLECYKPGNDPERAEKVACVLKRLNVLLRNGCVLHPYCELNPDWYDDAYWSDEDSILCDIQACIARDSNPSGSWWGCYFYMSSAIAIVYVVVVIYLAWPR